jgi:hypothetical protein
MAKRLGDRVVLKAGVESVRRKDGRFLGTTRRGTWRGKRVSSRFRPRYQTGSSFTHPL